jgi:formylglycine-generating enzyme required for sulfatase activity
VMGCTAEQGSDCDDDEKPAHKVTLSRSFYIQTTEVTQGQWKSVMGSNPSEFSGCDDCPVEQVSWDDAVAFAQKLSAKEGLSGGSVYRLPTEAEWEYAARAGQGTKYAGSNDADAVAWHDGNSGNKTHPVGQKSPNAWGLYDMSGNVYEWTADWYGGYLRGDQTNPEDVWSGLIRVFRGGCWDLAPSDAGVSGRSGRNPDSRMDRVGLRLLRTQQSKKGTKASKAKNATTAPLLEGSTNSVGMSFVEIPMGSFVMGCTAEQGSDCADDEKPAHNVTLSRSFYMQTTEVTQGQWRAVMGSNPSQFSSCDDCPVEQVSWVDAFMFARKLSAKEGLSGASAYRLPTEAEWEYAARAGQGTKYAGSNSLDSVAWHGDNSGSKTHPVGQKLPNAWGLYDMAGNVWEWTADWYGGYSSGDTTNPDGVLHGIIRVFRGGSWFSDPSGARVAYRSGRKPDYRLNRLGFRLLRTIP